MVQKENTLMNSSSNIYYYLTYIYINIYKKHSALADSEITSNHNQMQWFLIYNMTAQDSNGVKAVMRNISINGFSS